MICFKQFTFTISLILPKGFLFRAFRRMRNFSPWNCPASQLHRCFAKEGPNSWSGAGGWCQGIIIQRVYCTKNCRMQLLGREEDWGCLWVGKFDSLRFDAWITGILKDHSKMVVSNIFLCSSPTWVDDPIWLIIFQMGWNHPLVMILLLWILGKTC